MRVVTSLFFLTATVTSLACNNNQFSTGGGGRKIVKPVPKPAVARTVTDSFALKGEQFESRKVDIVFVVDTSGSMNEEKALLERNMASFIREFAANNNKMDYLVHLLGSDFNIPTAQGSINLVDQRVGSNDALAILYNYISTGYGGQTVRKESVVEAVVITDDNAYPSGDLPIRVNPFNPSFSTFQGSSAEISTLNAQEFSTLITQNMPGLKLRFNGLVGKREGQNKDWCHISEVGAEYEALAAMPQYKGTIADLCRDDWTPLLTELASDIIKRVEQTSIRLEFPPDLSRGYQVAIDGERLDARSISITPDGIIEIIDENLKKRVGTLTIRYAVIDN